MSKRVNLKVEIFDVYPTTLGHCPHYNLLANEMAAAGAEFCELSSQVTEYPNDVIMSHDRAVEVASFLRKELAGRAVDVSVEMVSLMSPTGFFKALRHRIKSNFAIVVGGRKVCEESLDWQALRREALSACSVPKITG